MPPPAPRIAFGQQPSGFFPKRFLVSKIFSARKLQSQIGGTIHFFYHDADHDPRETRTTLHHRDTHAPHTLNFEFENKLQRKFSPLYLKRIPLPWHTHTANALPNYISKELAQIFRDTPPTNVADFCLAIMQKMGLLQNIEIHRSSDPALRTAACDIADFFVDIPYQNEIVRARHSRDAFQLHEGGPSFITLPAHPFTKSQISPTRDSRLLWMQSTLHCTHYITGLGEQNYLDITQTPEITFIKRDEIQNADDAWTDIP
ncbi:MAG TPA: hypothetical protein VH253_18860 [Phycisphaerae bacterium]|nr:hypothetical protein [Phycisphaerae bacterium]